jgi:hypothetical protein
MGGQRKIEGVGREGRETRAHTHTEREREREREKERERERDRESGERRQGELHLS